MVDFFKEMFNELSENGVAIAIITAFNGLVTLIISKTIMLNQEQRFWMLVVIFLGLSLLSIVVLMMFKRSKDNKVEKTLDSEEQNIQEAKTQEDDSRITQRIKGEIGKQTAESNGKNSPINQTIGG